MSLPQYQSHKLVHAAKITALEETESPETINLVLELPSGETMGYGVSPDYVGKHKPQVGGYLVVYKDGYESWSPAEAFEEGYTIIEPNQPGARGDA